MFRLGIIQGRLSPMEDGRIQSFPAKNWRNEFDIAADCGFEIMEWVVDVDHPELNPIFSKYGKISLKNVKSSLSKLIVCGNKIDCEFNPLFSNASIASSYNILSWATC